MRDNDTRDNIVTDQTVRTVEVIVLRSFRDAYGNGLP